MTLTERSSIRTVLSHYGRELDMRKKELDMRPLDELSEQLNSTWARCTRLLSQAQTQYVATNKIETDTLSEINECMDFLFWEGHETSTKLPADVPMNSGPLETLPSPSGGDINLYEL